MPVLVVALLLLATNASAQSLTIGRVLVRSAEALERPAVEIDTVERLRVEGSWTTPDETSGWRSVEADAAGWIVDDALVHGYAYAEVEVDEESSWYLDAMGYAGVYVNDEPRIGNVYGYTDEWESWQPHFDFSRVPVRLRQGVNLFLFHGSRYGLMRARLVRAEERLAFNARDATLPDLVEGEDFDGWGSIVVLNPTRALVAGARIEARVGQGEPVVSELPSLPPFGVRKVGFRIRDRARPASGTATLSLRLFEEDRSVDEQALELAVKHGSDNRRVTFRSEVDGSVQYFGYLSATGGGAGKALVLSLHGAAVEAINQSGSYVPLSWAHLVAPTNRRPFGFSWEDWGRRDALEVLDLSRSWLDVDEDRIYLTGHSMGGHGSWHLATLYPDRFAAVGPSAGWISIWSYRQRAPEDEPDALTALVERGTAPSQTLEMVPNLAGLGVYVLHGADDDNVPPEQARLMLERLAEVHEDFVYHEEPGVGHWWDLSRDPGADCVSWPPMFDFFARHRRPPAEEIRHVRFRTPSPSVSVASRWVAVMQQQRPFVTSSADLERDAGWTRLSGVTENVTVLGLDWSREAGDSVRIELDGDAFVASVPADGRILLRREGRSETAKPTTHDPSAKRLRWRQVSGFPTGWKGPQNNGGFRSAFERRVQLVYGTGGTEIENAWALAKARHDAEWLWYQGNASVDVLPDTRFDPAAEPERSVVLYGHRGMHEDWAALLDDVVDVDRGSVRVDGRRLRGEQYGVLLVRPRPQSASASVGAVAATGPEGFRLMTRRPYLSLGVAYPDLTLFASDGTGPIVSGAGYFGNDWSVENGEFLWKETP